VTAATWLFPETITRVAVVAGGLTAPDEQAVNMTAEKTIAQNFILISPSLFLQSYSHIEQFLL
jgi:hypothetical protein